MKKTPEARRVLVVASNNVHKLSEIRAILGHSWHVIGAQEAAPGIKWDESGQTFIENARIKVAALRPHTRHCILADDSGLCVDALGGKPGVWSSSYGGIEGDDAANNKRLLEDLKEIPAERRQAYFQCVLVFENEHGQESIYEGRCDGMIASTRDGGGGFGYDPLFYLPEYKMTMAKLSEDEKNKISHRGRAMVTFMKEMSSFFARAQNDGAI